MAKSQSKLALLPCLDSAEMSEFCRQALEIPRHIAAALGASAVQPANEGRYLGPAGDRVDWSHHVQSARAAKQSIAPDEALPIPQRNRVDETRIQVINGTTLSASLRLVERGLRPLALNFANGIHPGGGFLDGARAQEEVLCRSSALYATLVGDPMYDAHRNREQPDSTDWAIYSPDVPVFRNDDGTALAQPWPLSFITCAAPYAPEIGQPKSGDLLRQRIHRLLLIASARGHTALVLGAWGCGAFGNDPHRTAVDFRHALEHAFKGVFDDVVFAIADWSPQRRYLGPFRNVFG